MRAKKGGIDASSRLALPPPSFGFESFTVDETRSSHACAPATAARAEEYSFRDPALYPAIRMICARVRRRPTIPVRAQGLRRRRQLLLPRRRQLAHAADRAPEEATQCVCKKQCVPSTGTTLSPEQMAERAEQEARERRSLMIGATFAGVFLLAMASELAPERCSERCLERGGEGGPCHDVEPCVRPHFRGEWGPAQAVNPRAVPVVDTDTAAADVPPADAPGEQGFAFGQDDLDGDRSRSEFANARMMRTVSSLARARSLSLVTDACGALGARRRRRGCC